MTRTRTSDLSLSRVEPWNRPWFQPWHHRLQTYRQELVVLGCIIILCITVGLYNENFFNESNLVSVFSGNGFIAVAAIGMSLVIITGHIDVSVGSLIGVLATLSGSLAVNGVPIWLAWLLPVLVGAGINGLVGWVVAYLRIPSIVVTLGMLSILKGGLISVTGGQWITDLPSGFFIAQQRWLGIPAPIWFMVVLTAITALWLHYTATGRSLYAVGGNPEAARAAGLNPKRVCVLAFALHGLLAGLAAVLFATQLQVIQSTVPPNLELTIITAAVIGGVSILGGTGTVIGASLAAILFACIGSALVFLNVSAYWLRAVLGTLILVTVLIDITRRHRREEG
ncbi:MAG: ABC transporter permease [Candidatus Symbiobacter sp.]|nr:ABC transporter permease [Candidatus Symbiobacter sp.]